MDNNKSRFTTDEIVNYMRKLGLNYTIETNPSPEKLAEIDRYLKRQKEIESLMRSKYNKSVD